MRGRRTKMANKKSIARVWSGFRKWIKCKRFSTSRTYSSSIKKLRSPARRPETCSKNGTIAIPNTQIAPLHLFKSRRTINQAKAKKWSLKIKIRRQFCQNYLPPTKMRNPVSRNHHKKQSRRLALVQRKTSRRVSVILRHKNNPPNGERLETKTAKDSMETTRVTWSLLGHQSQFFSTQNAGQKILSHFKCKKSNTRQWQASLAST